MLFSSFSFFPSLSRKKTTQFRQSHLGVGVLLEARIEDGVGDLFFGDRRRSDERGREKEKKKETK